MEFTGGSLVAGRGSGAQEACGLRDTGWQLCPMVRLCSSERSVGAAPMVAIFGVEAEGGSVVGQPAARLIVCLLWLCGVQDVALVGAKHVCINF
jgi:hypothetical protein